MRPRPPRRRRQPRRSAPHGLRADPLRGAGPHRHRHPESPRQAQRLDRRDGARGAPGDGRGDARRDGPRHRADRRRSRLLRGRRMQMLSGIVDAGTAARVETPRRPGPGRRATRCGPTSAGPTPTSRWCPSRSSRRSTGPPRASAWWSRSTATCASRPTAAVLTTAFSGRAHRRARGELHSAPPRGPPARLDLLARRKFTAAEALAMSALSQLHPAGALMDAVRAYGRELADLVSRARSG